MNIIKERRLEKNMTLEEVGDKVGVGKSTVRKWENGIIENMRRDNIVALSKALDISPLDILGIEESELTSDINTIYTQLEPSRQARVYNFAESQLEEQNTVRIYGQVAANPEAMEYVDESYEEYITDDVPRGAEGALVVTGDSMEDDYKNGSIVFYKRQPDVENGQLAVVEIDGVGTTFKKFYRDYDNQKIILRSINSKYSDRTLEPERVKIVGIVLN